MHKITPLALLVTGGLSAQAGAAVQTLNLQPSTEGTAVLIGNVTSPQYSYRAVKPEEGAGGSARYFLDTTSPTSYFTPPAAKDASDSAVLGPTYLQGSREISYFSDSVGLKFNIGDLTYVGTARFGNVFGGPDASGLEGANYATDPDGPPLLDVEYELATGVPETETWALLIAGLGATGAAMRRRRRTSTVTA